jgi:hypothetical protein
MLLTGEQSKPGTPTIGTWSGCWSASSRASRRCSTSGCVSLSLSRKGADPTTQLLTLMALQFLLAQELEKHRACLSTARSIQSRVLDTTISDSSSGAWREEAYDLLVSWKALVRPTNVVV